MRSVNSRGFGAARGGAKKLPDFGAGLTAALQELERRTGFKLDTSRAIAEDVTFRQWCNKLAADGLKVDGFPFTLDDRPSMHFIYDLIPNTIEEANRRIVVMMKCAQVGFTVMEMLACIYMALKFEPCKIGMYLPDMKLAAAKSSERFMPIIRTVPQAYERLTEEDPDTKARKSGEGNVMIRSMGDSRFHFLWTSGKATTESFPMDMLSFDEVQEMAIADMEKTQERLSASRIRFTLMGSTANWPDMDIHWWFKRGTQHQFYTYCEACGHEQIMDEVFPDCIGYDDDTEDYRYRCVHCRGWLADTQQHHPDRPHGWVPKNPGAQIVSVHYTQFLSPTITARDMIEAYQSADDMKNFYNRKLGKPYMDPSQIPVNMEMLNACAAEGVAAGLTWKLTAKNTFMGIDQMGRFNVVIIKERMDDGRQATVHLEYIYSDDPFERCSALMDQYGVQCCVVETLPNYNDAKRFAQRHPGRVFLAGYGNIEGEMLRWGDAPKLDTSERRTSEEERDRYTVTLDQYKCMQVSMARIAKRQLLFPDPSKLTQEVIEKGLRKTIPVLKDIAFLHFTRTALLAEKDEEEKKYKRRVVKVGIDPHTSYANMLCDVAWARAYGTSTFILPTAGRDTTKRQENVQKSMPGLPDQVVAMVQELSGEVCGRCSAFDATTRRCSERDLLVRPTDAACIMYLEAVAG